MKTIRVLFDANEVEKMLLRGEDCASNVVEVLENQEPYKRFATGELHICVVNLENGYLTVEVTYPEN